MVVRRLFENPFPAVIHWSEQDPDLGYTQGMCFAAAVVAVGDGDLAGKQQRFSQLMEKLRLLV